MTLCCRILARRWRRVMCRVSNNHNNFHKITVDLFLTASPFPAIYSQTSDRMSLLERYENSQIERASSKVFMDMFDEETETYRKYLGADLPDWRVLISLSVFPNFITCRTCSPNPLSTSPTPTLSLISQGQPSRRRFISEELLWIWRRSCRRSSLRNGKMSWAEGTKRCSFLSDLLLVLLGCLKNGGKIFWRW